MVRSRQKSGYAETLFRRVAHDGNGICWGRGKAPARTAILSAGLLALVASILPHTALAGEGAGHAAATGIAPLTRLYNFNQPKEGNKAAEEHGPYVLLPSEIANISGIGINPPRASHARNDDDASGQAVIIKQEPPRGKETAKAVSRQADESAPGAVAQRAEADAPATARPANVPGDAGAQGVDTGAAASKEIANGGIANGRIAGSGIAGMSLPAVDDAVEQSPNAAAPEGNAIKTASITPGPSKSPAQVEQVAAPLYLETFINGQPTNLIAEFVQLPGGGFASRARELDELGIRVPKETPADELVALKDISAQARYDEEEQKIDILLPPEKLKRHVLDLSHQQPVTVTPGGIGLVLNYSVLASARTEDTFTKPVFDGVSAQLEGWTYSPYGTLFSSGIIKHEHKRGPRAIRLDTRWEFVDMERAIHYQVGDLITAGPGWARPVRMGGVQVRRSFKLRPDIISVPLPRLSGTASVPTAIDVYVNNLKVHSGKVQPGPFDIANIPALAQNGVARLVMRDASGKEIVREQSFYVSPKLLRADLFEFSLAAGVPRRGYGEKSFDYDWRYPGVNASARYGLSDSVTLQGHVEAARNLILGGAGVNFTLFDSALLSASGAVSHSSQGTGFLTHVTAETHIGGLHISASSLRTFGDYVDLAALSSMRGAAKSSAVLGGTQVPRAVESLNVGYALGDYGAALTAGLVHTRRRDGERTRSLNIGYSQNLFGRANLYATALFDLDDINHPSFFAGFSMPLGGGTSASASGAYDAKGGYRASASYSKALKSRDNAVGWRARVSYGDIKSLEGSLAWRTPYATLRGTAMQVNKATLGQVSVEGALVMADGALFAANRIHDSFAIVNAGAPGVRVRYENRVVGKTRGDGRMLVTSLHSLQRNKISVDPETMPVDAVIEDDKTYVVPAVRAGVVVKFNTKRATRAALVVLQDAHGKPIAPGAEVKLAGAQETFIVGYDGEAYLDGLKKHNTVEVSTADGVCHASFDFTPGKEVQPRIGPVVCKP